MKNKQEIGELLYDACRVMLSESEDSMRSAEINNILTPLSIALGENEFLKSDESEKYLQSIINEMKPRIMALIANPEPAGNHEQFKI